MAQGENLLAAAKRVWQDCRGEFQGPPADDLAEESPLPNASEEMKKVTKWIQHGVTKFGASASVAEGEELTRGLKPIAEEVIKAFTAASGLLLTLKRGAGASLLAELNNTGSSLASAIEELGKSVGTSEMSVCCGKVLDRAKTLERTSTHNRAAIRRRLLGNLSQLRDAHRELQETAKSGGDGEEGDDDFFDDFDVALEPEERRLVETIAELAGVCVEVLKRVSTACIPSKEEGATTSAVADLEVAVAGSTTAASAMDGLAVAANGGLDANEFTKSFEEMSSAVNGLLASPVVGEDGGLRKSLEAVDVAFKAAVAADAES